MEQDLATKPHPQLLEALFIFRFKIFCVFQEVLGLYGIDHIAVSRINSKQEILIFSSSPALEFNLFSSGLWRFDHSYQPSWFKLCKSTHWHELYSASRYDELYYIKQIKPHFPIGKSLAARLNDGFVIYSLASKRSCQATQDIFSKEDKGFYQIGQYCTKKLHSLFLSFEAG